MKEQLYEICKSILGSEEEAEKFRKMKTVDAMYEYFLGKVPELSKEEFEDFIIDILEKNKKSQETPNAIDDDALENVAGGFNMGTKLASAGLAAMALFSGASVGATSKGSDNFGAQSGSAIVQSVDKDKQSVVSEKFDKVKNWIKDNVNAVTGRSIGSTTLDVTANTTSKENNKQMEAQWFTAAQEGQLDVIKKLLDKGININAKDENGQTALMHAAMYHNNAILKELINRGADLSIKDNDGYTALMNAAFHCDVEGTKELINRGSDLNAKTNNGMSIFHVAAWGGKEEIMDELLKRGFDLNAKYDSGKTALMLAAGLGNEKVIKYLISRGADCNAKDKRGRTALIIAADNYSEEAVKELIKGGADLNIKDKDGKTALSLAIEFGNKEIIEALKQAGAK